MNKTKLKLFLKFLKFIFPYRKRWLIILILSGLSSLLNLINPYLSKLVVDKAIGNKDIKLFVILVLIGGSVFVIGTLIDGIKQFLDRYIKVKVGFDLNKKVYKKMQHFSFSWFKDKSTGEHLYKISYDIDRVEDFITTALPEAISIIPRLLFTLAIVFYLNQKMALFSLCLAPFLYLPPYYFSRRMRIVWNALIEGSQDIFKNLEETFSHILLVKAFGKEASSIRKYLKGLITNIRIGIKNIKLEIISGFVSQAVSKAIIGLITFYGIYQVIKGKVTLGTFIAIMVYLNQLMELQGRFAYFFQTTVLGLVSCERIDKILNDSTEIIETKEAKRVAFKRGEVIFKNVSFGYKEQEYVLKDIGFSVDSENHIALVGPSGCGKTTILNLILRLYDPWQGEIFIDGYNIKNLKLNSLKEQVGIALQEPFLWNDTVYNNIGYGKEDANSEEIIRIAQLTGVDEFVKGLPFGYETIIGENACKISEGQKQKIAVGRALIKRPRILILDEAMSSMDSASEERILSNIKQAQTELTLITVSHRLSTVMNADLVYYLESNDTIIIDTALNLLENNQGFANLFVGQSKICV